MASFSGEAGGSRQIERCPAERVQSRSDLAEVEQPAVDLRHNSGLSGSMAFKRVAPEERDYMICVAYVFVSLGSHLSAQKIARVRGFNTTTLGHGTEPLVTTFPRLSTHLPSRDAE